MLIEPLLRVQRSLRESVRSVARLRSEAARTTTKIVARGFGDPGVLAVVQAKQRSPGRNAVTVAVRSA